MARPRLGGAIWGQSWTEERCESSLEGSGRGDSGRCSARHSSIEFFVQYMPLKAGWLRTRSERHARSPWPTPSGFSGRGVFNPHRGCERPWLRRLRATERAHCGGVSLARSHANSEGPHRRASLLGRSRRSFEMGTWSHHLILGGARHAVGAVWRICREPRAVLISCRVALVVGRRASAVSVSACPQRPAASVC